MDSAVRSRLNVLIILCSGVFGIVLAQLVLGQPSGLQLAFISLFPTAIVILLAFLYIDYNSTEITDTEDRADS